MLSATTVYPTTDPGAAEDVFAVTVNVSPGTSTGTAVEHRASVLPAPQLLPAAAVDTTVPSVLSPVSAAFTVTENVTDTTAPAARLPVQVSTGLAYDTDPAVADASPSYTASSSTPDSESATVIPVYAVCPVSVIVTVKPTTDPGVADATPAEFTIVSPGTSTGTDVPHAAAGPATGQLLPGVGDVIAVTSTLSPVSGLFTVTENVTVTVAPAARLPVHIRPGLTYDNDPPVADASPLYTASSSTPDSESVNVAPV